MTCGLPIEEHSETIMVQDNVCRLRALKHIRRGSSTAPEEEPISGNHDNFPSVHSVSGTEMLYHVARQPARQ